MINWFIDENTTLEQAMLKLDKSGKGCLVITKGNKLVAVISDGDIRRSLLKGETLKSPVSRAANYQPTYLLSSERRRAEQYMKEKGIRVLPIVNDDLEVTEIVCADERVTLNGVTMRKIEPEDYDKLMAFFDQMSGDTRAMFNRLDVNTVRAIKYLKGEGEDEIHFGAFLNVDGKEIIVGYVFLWELNTTIPWLGIAVHEKYKGYHLGRQLLTLLDDYCMENGYGGLLLTTVPANIRAHSLYSRMGYEYMGMHPCGEFLYIKRFKKEDK